MRLVIDINDFISALIGKKHREKLGIILSNPSIDLYADENLLVEPSEVAGREKFRRYVTPDEVALFVDAISTRLIVIKPSTIITDSPDPDDTYLLSLAVDAQADFLITGDKRHLLALSPFQGIPIIRFQALLDVLGEQ